MDSHTNLMDAAMQFIQQLDNVAYEDFTSGKIRAEEYLVLAKQIATLQRLVLLTLDDMDPEQSNSNDAYRYYN